MRQDVSFALKMPPQPQPGLKLRATQSTTSALSTEPPKPVLEKGGRDSALLLLSSYMTIKLYQLWTTEMGVSALGHQSHGP